MHHPRCTGLCLIQVHILATDLSFDDFANSDTHLTSDRYGAVNDETLPSNLVQELFRSVPTEMPKLKK